MTIHTAEFIISNTNPDFCPTPDRPEFAFTGRSNVGKSSLINLITNRKSLAKTSGKPGKTQTINHFLVNKTWYLVDLPGYGYAGVSRTARQGWSKMMEEYLLKRENLFCVFVLLDARLDLQPIDLEFITWLGKKQLPLALVLTKADKLKKSEILGAQKRITEKLLVTWEEMPPLFITSAEKKTGHEPIYALIEKAMKEEL